SASLMPNLAAAEDALAQAAECPRLGLGLHLTLTAGRPLSPPEMVPTLVDRSDRFPILGEMLARLSLGRVRRVDLEREMETQIVWLLDRRVPLDHLDAHHHIHVHPRVAELTLDLATRYGIPYVRCPDEGLSWPAPREAHTRDLVRAATIWLFARRLRSRLGPSVRAARHFRGIVLGAGFTSSALVRALSRLRPGLSELMTHPGYPDAELARMTVYAEGRNRELAALTAPGARSLVEATRIHLTTFREQADAGSYTL
ncbi:MAG: ChbG/HpnK family deacetylase, partial [Chloroflexi bacterium]|nr:ChbG/HpnK family deacetylase [Chloroflexota bacterium]